VVDDHALVAQSLTLALRAQGVSATRCESMEPASVLSMARAQRPTLVLLDLDLGDHHDGTELLPDLRAYGADVLVFTGTLDRFRIAAAIASGAVGWVSKTVSFDVLLAQVLDVVAGRQVLSPDERQSLVNEYHRGRAERDALLSKVDKLSSREWTVLQHLADGLHADAVAAELNVSVHTVRAQIRSIHSKLDVDSQLAAVAIVRRAEELGLPTPLRER
jgi:two-component system, NarL family, nitrate/nitrite response regulator NarL